jgi:hypothetical protein
MSNRLFSKISRWALRSTQPPLQWVLAVLPQGVKQPGCEVDQLPPPNVMFKNEKNYTSPSPTCLHGMDKDNFTFANKLKQINPHSWQIGIIVITEPTAIM